MDLSPRKVIPGGASGSAVQRFTIAKPGESTDTSLDVAIPRKAIEGKALGKLTVVTFSFGFSWKARMRKLSSAPATPTWEARLTSTSRGEMVISESFPCDNRKKAHNPFCRYDRLIEPIHDGVDNVQSGKYFDGCSRRFLCTSLSWFVAGAERF